MLCTELQGYSKNDAYGNNYQYIKLSRNISNKLIEGCEIQHKEYQTLINNIQEITDIEDIITAVKPQAMNNGDIFDNPNHQVTKWFAKNGFQFEFKCPLFTTELGGDLQFWDSKGRYCKVCNKSVSYADNLEALKSLVGQGYCVEFKPFDIYSKKTAIKYLKSTRHEKREMFRGRGVRRVEPDTFKIEYCDESD